MKHVKVVPHRRIASIIAMASWLTLAHLHAKAEVPLGIGTHFGQSSTNEQLLFKWMAESPFTSFRDEIYWGDVEQTAGQFQPSKRALRTLQTIDTASQSGIEPLIILDYGNKYYDEGSQPYSASGREGFARYADWVVRATNGKVKKFEIWNEWNIGAGKKPKVRHGDAGDYAKLVQSASAAIHKANPGAQVIGGSTTDDVPDGVWLQEAIQQGLLNYVDGISIHTYNHSFPLHKGGAREMLSRVSKVHEILTKAAPSRVIPIYITEIGWPNNIGKFGVSITDAATQATIYLLEVNALDYVKGVWFYEFHDHGRDKGEREDNFGLLDADDQPKPAECAIRTIGGLLKGAQLIEAANQGASRAMLYRLKDGSQLLGTWTYMTSAEPSTNTLAFKGSKLKLTPLDLGCFKAVNTSQISVNAAGLRIEQGYSPSLYLLPKDARLNLK
jgi:hypothetical protein